MMRRIVRRDEARRDIVQIARYIAHDSRASAERFLTAVETALQLVLENPGIGTLRDSPKPELVGLRQHPIRGFRRYLIFYRETDEGIDLVRVLHGARDLQALLDG